MSNVNIRENVEINGFVVEKLESFPENANPYCCDFYHMGDSVGENVEIMFSCISKEKCRYLIIVDKISGRRIKVLI